MVNLGTGNMLLQDTDVSVPHKGIAFEFRRTYNSQSLHDVSGDDGGVPGLYGNGWTATWDAHMVKQALGTYSVYDIDGARYDYFTQGFTSGTPATLSNTTAGDHSQLVFDGYCSMLWTKKSGTTYVFFAPRPSSSCPSVASGTVGAYSGRLHQIVGRNANINLTFAYTWMANAQTGDQPQTMTVTAESGLTATLAYGAVNGHQLLQSLTMQGGTNANPTNYVVNYLYDNLGNLTDVTSPANDTAGTLVHRDFAYGTSGNTAMSWASSPRWFNSNGTDGDWVGFQYAGGSTNATSTLSFIGHNGFVNPAPADGTGSPIQPNYGTGISTYLQEFFQTGLADATYRDSDGHYTNWVFDSSARPIQTQECTASQVLSAANVQCTGSLLISNESWDAGNDLSSSVNARGFETDYAYDADGNTVAMAEPAAQSGGTRPTHLYAYDWANNVLAYCDPAASDRAGADWTSGVPANAQTCLGSTNATRMQWSDPLNGNAANSLPAYEPFGQLQQVTTQGSAAAPNGYHMTYSYSTNQQGGTDYGLPSDVVGDPISQSISSIDSNTPSSRQPQQHFWYDPNGNLLCYNKGNGTWLLSYDLMGRQTSVADPDDSAAGSGPCGKTGTQANWSTADATAYFPSGMVAQHQSASQRAQNIATQFTYDVDGNEKTETHHYGCMPGAACTPGITTKWYDGADRLVEVSLPSDGWDVQNFPWLTRYVYDLSAGSTVAYNGSAVRGYGNLVKTQQFLSGTKFQPFPASATCCATPLPMSSATWKDVRATSFDALDRAMSQYEAAFGNVAKIANTYDTNGNIGLLSSVTRASGETSSYLYDGLGRKTDTTYSGDNGITPALHSIYDLDGRPTSQSTSALGAETMQYDNAGNLMSVTEPSSLFSQTISYDYYPDGKRMDLNYASGSYSATALYRYGYRADGKRTSYALNSGQYFAWSYTSAGREVSQRDPLTGATIQPSSTAPTGKSPVGKPYYPSSLSYVPETFTYDTYGRISTQTLPEGVFSYQIAHDDEDGVFGFTGTANVQTVQGTTQTEGNCVPTTIRNEKAPTDQPCLFQNGILTYTSQPTVLPELYNGAQFGKAPNLAYQVGTTSYPRYSGALKPWTLDARSGQLFSWSVPTPDGPTGATYSYDASGRQTEDDESLNRPWKSGDSFNSTQNLYTTGTRTKAYDAENHIVAENYSVGSGGSGVGTTGDVFEPGAYWADQHGGAQPHNISSIKYNAANHPISFTYQVYGAPGSYTDIWAWDGGDRFDTCATTSGVLSCSFDMEGLGIYVPAGAFAGSPTFTSFGVADRGPNGNLATSHDATGFGGWQDGFLSSHNYLYGAVFAPCSESGGSPGTFDCSGVASDKVSADGWTYGDNTFQGVRTYDPTVGQWNTPDAYAGDVHDPMSQQPFMWNNNNPYVYEDPSGYETGAVSLMGAPGVSTSCSSSCQSFWGEVGTWVVIAAVEVLSEGTVQPGSVASALSRGAQRDSQLESEAVSQRDALAASVGAKAAGRPATVTAGYVKSTGKVAAGCSGSRGCAEDAVVEKLGAKASDVQFTSAVRPRAGGGPYKQVPVCKTNCQQKYKKSQFQDGTQFSK